MSSTSESSTAAVALLAAAYLFVVYLIVGGSAENRPETKEHEASFSRRCLEEGTLWLLTAWAATPLVNILIKLCGRAFGFCVQFRSTQLVLPIWVGEAGPTEGYGTCSNTEPHQASCAASQLEQQAPTRCPIMASQETFLAWQLTHPEGTALHEAWCVWLESGEKTAISGETIQRSFLAVLKENEVLRTKFAVAADGTWTQEFLSAEALFPQVYSDSSASDEAEALQLADAALHAPLRIFDGICIRVGAIHITRCKALLYVVQHHVVTDAKSMLLLYAALSAQYRSRTSGSLIVGESGHDPGKLIPGYKEIAARRSQACHGDPMHLEWWRRHLRGATGEEQVPQLDLPLDKPEPARSSFEVVVSAFSITPELSDGIQELARCEGLTTFEVLLALHSSWLALMSRSENVLVWTNHHGRNGESTTMDGLLGCYVGQLPLKLEPRRCDSFRAYLHAAAKIKRDALLHCQVSPAQLFSLANAQGSNFERAHNVLTYYADRFSVAGIEAETARREFSPGIRARLGQLEKRTGTGLLQVLFMKDANGQLHGYAKFAADRTSQETANRFVSHFVDLASAAVADPGCKVGALPLMRPEEEARLDAFHGPPLPVAPHSVVELLNRCAEASPCRVALEHEATGEQMTYATLAARSRALALQLTAWGLVRNSLVTLLLERSVEMVVAVHGVWAAGCGYAPMDVDAPPEYHGVIATDVATHNSSLGAPAVLLTQSWLWHPSHGPAEVAVVGEASAHVLHMDALKADSSRVSSPLAPELDSESLAYCMYTSGSTGRPKGVLVPHRGITNHLHAYARRLEPVEQQDIFLQKTPYIFDVSVPEFTTPLLSSAKLLILAHNMHKDLEYLFNAMARCGVTRVRFVPSQLDLFLEVLRQKLASSGNQEMLPSLRDVAASGEVLRACTVRSWSELLPHAAIYDLYGPTEASVEVTMLQCTARVLRPGRKTLGRALDGVDLHVVVPLPRGLQEGDMQSSCEFRRQPVGLHGELLIGGPQVAMGYLNRPQLTREAFVPSSLPGRHETLLYRTGDLTKWRADGELVYIGRIDRQVKLHGLRIELGAVEGAAVRSAGVSEAVAKLHADGDGFSSRLLLFVSPGHVDTSDVLGHCRQALPTYMVPSEVIALDKWPRTGSGKIDQKQLLPPAGQRVDGREGPQKDTGMLIEKIKSKGVVQSMADEEIVQEGWSSFEVMRVHAQIMRDQDRCISPASASAKVNNAIIALVGHVWCFVMVLVLLEWLVAYWEWYGAVPRLAMRWFVGRYWPLERLNALGRLLGDPVFVMLFSIQDMQDVRSGRTSKLCRRFLLFAAFFLLCTFVDLFMLQGPFVRFGWVSADWALDISNRGGTLNCGVFLFARSFFLIFAILLSLGSCCWIHWAGVVQWPWACLALALLVPALVEGVHSSANYGDGSLLAYISANRDFIIELCPYYYFFPLFVGGAEFPRAIVTKRVQLSDSNALAVQLCGLVLFVMMLHAIDVYGVSEVDALSNRHVVWVSFLARFNSGTSWPLLEIIKKNCDLYSAAAISAIFVFLAMAMPIVPSDFSLLGTRVMGAYMTMPMTLIATGHFVGPVLLAVPENYEAFVMPFGILAVLLLCLILPSQQFLPDFLLRWVEHGDFKSKVR